MARRAHATLINDVESELQDSANAVYSATELAVFLLDALRELSNYVPLIVRNTLTTTASKDLSIADYLDILWIEELEYEIDQDPREFIKWDEHYTGVISMLDIDTPSAGESVYLYCAKPQKVPTLTTLAGAATAGYAAGVSTINVDGLLPATGTLEADLLFTIASDSTGTVYRLTADTVLSGGAGDIVFTPVLAEAIANNDVVTFENSTLTPSLEALLIQLTAAKAQISKASSLLAEGQKAIAVLDTINTILGEISAKITQATNDISAGRTEVDKTVALITEANTALDKIDLEITKSVLDLETARTKIPQVNKGGPEASEFARVASGDVANARGYLDEAIGYIRQSSADESVGGSYGALAIRELNTAVSSLSHAGGYTQKISSSLRIAQTARLYREEGERRLALVRAELRGLAKPRAVGN